MNFLFSEWHVPKSYAIFTQSCKVRTTDRAVEFSIKKQEDEAWPRLTESQKKLPWLKIDFDKFEYDDDSEDEEAGKQAADDLMKQMEKEMGSNKGNITIHIYLRSLIKPNLPKELYWSVLLLRPLDIVTGLLLGPPLFSDQHLISLYLALCIFLSGQMHYQDHLDEKGLFHVTLLYNKYKAV